MTLRGADLVLMARHRQWKNVGRCHNTLLAVELDGPVEAERVTCAVERLLDVCPWPAARLRRPFPWGKLSWRAGPRERLGRPPVRRAAIGARAPLGEALGAELNAPIDARREPPVRILLLDGGPDRPSALALTWFHPLMDARGGQNLLAHLDRLDRGGSAAAPDGAPADFAPARDARTLRERGRIAGSSLRYMRALATEPPVSPATALVPPGRSRFRQESFCAPDAAAAPRASREISWRLAWVGRAMAELWERRRLPDVPFLLPISVDLRPKGEPGATFGNQLAFHFARFRPSDTGDVPALARALRRQMVDAVRDGQIEANAVAMEFLRYCPLPLIIGALPWTAGGELFSFNCADLGEWPPALARCFGRRVVNAYHVPVVPPRPGIGIFFNRCDGRNNLVASWTEGVVSEGEAARIIDVVREGMRWTRAS